MTTATKSLTSKASLTSWTLSTVPLLLSEVVDISLVNTWSWPGVLDTAEGGGVGGGEGGRGAVEDLRDLLQQEVRSLLRVPRLLWGCTCCSDCFCFNLKYRLILIGISNI